MRCSRWGTLIALCGLLPGLVVKPAAAQNDATFVPWPDSIRLLGIVVGDQTAMPPLIDRCGTHLAIQDDRAFELLATLEEGLGEIRRHLLAMRRIAIRVALGDPERASHDRRFQRRMGRVQQITAGAVFDGVLVFDSGLEVCLESVQYVLPLPIATPVGLGIQGLGVDREFRASAALQELDTAIDRLAALILVPRLGARALDDGPPSGGLREQRRRLQYARRLVSAARNGTLGYSERRALQRALEHELARVEDVGRNARFRGHELLVGEIILDLQTAPQPGSVRAYKAPDLTVEGLGLSEISIDSFSNLVEPLARIQAAMDKVTKALRAAEVLRRQLRTPPLAPNIRSPREGH